MYHTKTKFLNEPQSSHHLFKKKIASPGNILSTNCPLPTLPSLLPGM